MDAMSPTGASIVWLMTNYPYHRSSDKNRRRTRPWKEAKFAVLSSRDGEQLERTGELSILKKDAGTPYGGAECNSRSSYEQ